MVFPRPSSSSGVSLPANGTTVHRMGQLFLLFKLETWASFLNPPLSPSLQDQHIIYHPNWDASGSGRGNSITMTGQKATTAIALGELRCVVTFLYHAPLIRGLQWLPTAIKIKSRKNANDV